MWPTCGSLVDRELTTSERCELASVTQLSGFSGGMIPPHASWFFQMELPELSRIDIIDKEGDITIWHISSHFSALLTTSHHFQHFSTNSTWPLWTDFGITTKLYDLWIRQRTLSGTLTVLNICHKESEQDFICLPTGLIEFSIMRGSVGGKSTFDHLSVFLFVRV